MEEGNWFLYANPTGGYYGVRKVKRLKKEDKELFNFMIEHFTERYEKLLDEDKVDFRDKVEDIFCDFFLGQEFGDQGDYYPFGIEGGAEKPESVEFGKEHHAKFETNNQTNKEQIKD